MRSSSLIFLLALATPALAHVDCQGRYSSIYDGWCDSNCNHNPPNCDMKYCKCAEAEAEPEPTPTPEPVGTCRGAGRYATSSFIARWCQVNCHHVPAYCPAMYCDCTAAEPAEPCDGSCGDDEECNEETNECESTLPCGGACGDDEVCNEETNQCERIPCGGGCGDDEVCLEEADYCYPLRTDYCETCYASLGTYDSRLTLGKSAEDFALDAAYLTMMNCALPCEAGVAFRHASCGGDTTTVNLRSSLHFVLQLSEAANLMIFEICAAPTELVVTSTYDQNGLSPFQLIDPDDKDQAHQKQDDICTSVFLRNPDDIATPAPAGDYIISVDGFQDTVGDFTFSVNACSLV